MRVAIFFTPPPGHPLTRAASEWLGRDAYSGAAGTPDASGGVDPDELRGLVAAPRRYGFHATLKPPFRIAAGHGAEDIDRALAAFCRRRLSIPIAALEISVIGSFFALTLPPGPSLQAVNALAGDVVRAFDHFRAAPSPDEIGRRQPYRLTPRQRASLAAFGYPYLFEDFRFHMTLTGPVPPARRERIRRALEQRFAPLLVHPPALDSLSLFAEPDPPGDFIVRTRALLAPALAVEA